MKRGLILILIIIMMFSMISCSTNLNNQVNTTIPSNKSLVIAGKWEFKEYKILDENIISDQEIINTMNNNLIINYDSLLISSKKYSSIEYKLKSVKKDYVISYKNEFLIKDLGINKINTSIFSIIKNKNIFAELIYNTKEESYLYFNGVLFTIHYLCDIGKCSKDEEVVNNTKSELKTHNEEKNSEGLLLALSGKSLKEQYRTVWININGQEVKSIKYMNDIIFPTINGLWSVSVNDVVNKDKNIDYEYLSAKNLEKNDNDRNKKVEIKNGQKQKIKINYVGSNFIATEITKYDEKDNVSTDYRILPTDSIESNKGIEFGDIYSDYDLGIYKKRYEYAFKDALDDSSDDQESFCENVDYSNFTLYRENGKWNIKGKVPSLSSGSGYDFNLEIAPNKKIVNYDTLIVPWKILKGIVPLITDAFTSPDGKMAVIIANNEMQIYKVNSGRLAETPIKIIKLYEGEKVIMSEWCDEDNIEMWNNIINKEP